MKQSSVDQADLKKWVRFCLERAVLVSFKYDSLFSAVFQSEHGSRTIEATLAIGSQFWVSGTAVGAESSLKEQDRPEQAFHLMTLVGRTVRSVALESSSILLVFEPEGTLEVSGLSQVWDFAWHLGVPAQEANEESVSVDCASDGELFCSWENDFAAHLAG